MDEPTSVTPPNVAVEVSEIENCYTGQEKDRNYIPDSDNECDEPSRIEDDGSSHSLFEDPKRGKIHQL